MQVQLFMNLDVITNIIINTFVHYHPSVIIKDAYIFLNFTFIIHSNCSDKINMFYQRFISGALVSLGDMI